MNDIEDLVFEETERLDKTHNKVRQRRCKSPATLEETAPVTTLPNSIPGTQRIWVKTWGCSHNRSDGEYMAGLLEDWGYTVTFLEEEKDEADLWILNSCTVKGPSQMKFLTQTKRGSEAGKKIVVTGCVPEGEKSMNELLGLSMIGVQQIDRVVEVVEETLKGNTVQLFGSKKTKDEMGRTKRAGGARLDLPKIRRNPLIEIIAINTGCLNNCTYCKTKHARGDLASYEICEIVDRALHVLTEGVREIWLTSEDTGAYGIDIGCNIAELLEALAEAVKGKEVMIRVGMTNPPYMLEHVDRIADILNLPNFYAFLHLPVQSGSDIILEEMRRKYTRADFELCCDTLIRKVENMHIATDFIMGFPGETEEDHRESVELLKKYQFKTVNLSQFYPRKGTVAAKMKKLNSKIVKARSREMDKIWKSYNPWKDRVGEEYLILVTEKATDGYHFVGHNKYYDHVLVEPQEDFDVLGKYLKVKVFETGKFYQKARLIHPSPVTLEGKEGDSYIFGEGGLSNCALS